MRKIPKFFIYGMCILFWLLQSGCSSPVTPRAEVPLQEKTEMAESPIKEERLQTEEISHFTIPKALEQKTTVTQGISQAKKILSPKLAPGDTIRIDVVDEKEFSGSFVISHHGTIIHPIIKEVLGQGKTVEEFTKELKEKFSAYLVDPVVNIAVTWVDRKVYVSGGQKKLEVINLTPSQAITATQLLMNSGLPEDADLTEIYITRNLPGQREQKMVIPMQEIIETQNWDKDVVIESGDFIVIPKSSKVYIHGKVVKPGVFSISKKEPLSLWNLILLAQGPMNEADLEHIKILRQNNTKMDVRIVGVSVHGAMPLEANDIVLVPSAIESVVTIYGEVKKPGTIPVSKNTRLSTVLALAGGLTEYASNWIEILRYTPDGKTEKFSIHFKKILAGEKDQDIELKPGDVIHIAASIF